MQPWVTVATARVDGSDLVLARRGAEWAVRVSAHVLMTSRVHQSEIALATEAIARADSPKRILVGGLGLGYTLRAALDRVGPDARVTVAELVPELVTWNRTHLASLHDHALDDPRAEVAPGDVYALLRRSARAFDVIVLDVDNGPQALSKEENQRLYDDDGTRAAWEALAPGGVLGVWSAGPSDPYVKRLARFGFRTEVVRAPTREGGRATHVLFLAKKPAR